MTRGEALGVVLQALGPGWSWIPFGANAAGSLIFGFATALIAVACTRYRADSDAPWYEMARRTFPRRSALGMTFVAIPIAMGTFGCMLTSPLSIVPPAVIAAVNVLAALIGPAVVTWRVGKGWREDPAPVGIGVFARPSRHRLVDRNRTACGKQPSYRLRRPDSVRRAARAS